MYPSDPGYFFACLRRHGSFRGYARDDVEFDPLFFDLKFEECVGEDKWRYIVSCLLIDLSLLQPGEGCYLTNGTVDVRFILVDFPSWKRPATALPSSDKDALQELVASLAS